MIRRRAERLALERLRARVVMVGDLLEPSGARIVDQRVEGDDRARQIVEQRGETIVEERQPVLHALMLTPCRDRLVERVVARDRAEQRDIALAEGAPHLRRERHLAHGQKLHEVAPRLGPLRVGIEGPDLFERVAEEIEADRLAARRIKVEDAAAHRILPRVGDGAGARIAGDLQPLDQRLHAHDIAGLKLEARAGDEVARRHALHQRR